MPYLFLSPSTQEFNPYVTRGNEEYWMNRIADAMEPFLRASGINFTRNDPASSAAAAIRESNGGQYDLHLALHSNAAGPSGAGNVRGVDVYYYPTSREGLAMANLIVENIRPVYPLPDRVRALPTTRIGEVRRTDAPAVLAELGYHDNEQDAKWIEDSERQIAAALAKSVAQFFGLPFLEPSPVRAGRVRVSSGGVNLRSAPDLDSGVYRSIPNGESVLVYGAYDDWYTVGYDGTNGYVKAQYIEIA
ncbi:MAG: N-acetylmuramoyl-L-alanine amidase [Oscillospiraceae bacterium]|nr:N-acetylmuramoyl-L-alanine amidase [Oscillospiraceae bacterium]